jgi:hypothetical protein
VVETVGATDDVEAVPFVTVDKEGGAMLLLKLLLDCCDDNDDDGV